MARGLRHGSAKAAAGGSASRVVWRRWAPSAEKVRLGRQGGAEVGRREVGRGGRRRGKRAWVAGLERRSREVAEPPDGPALKEEIATPGNSRYSFLEKRPEKQNGLGELLLSGNFLYVK